jgi:hypothetical protein
MNSAVHFITHAGLAISYTILYLMLECFYSRFGLYHFFLSQYIYFVDVQNYEIKSTKMYKLNSVLYYP